MIILPKSSSRPTRTLEAAPTLGWAIGDYLENSIVEGRLEPGKPLTEKDLAAELNISSTPIRDALIRLSQIGLVEIFSNRLKRVSSLNAQSAFEIVSYRILVATEAWRLAAAVTDSVIVGQLGFQLDRLEAAMNADMRSEAVAAICEFERLVIETSYSAEAVRILEGRRSYLARHIFMCCAHWPDRDLLARLRDGLSEAQRNGNDAFGRLIPAIWVDFDAPSCL